jgi:hypothetical protein
VSGLRPLCWRTQLNYFSGICAGEDRLQASYRPIRDRILQACVAGRLVGWTFMFAGAAASPGAALLQTLRLNCPFNLIGRKPRLEKQVRASTQTACFESGRVLLPHEAPWVADYGGGAPRLPISKVRRPRRQHDDLSGICAGEGRLRASNLPVHQ